MLSETLCSIYHSSNYNCYSAPCFRINSDLIPIEYLSEKQKISSFDETLTYSSKSMRKLDKIFRSSKFLAKYFDKMEEERKFQPVLFHPINNSNTFPKKKSPDLIFETIQDIQMKFFNNYEEKQTFLKQNPSNFCFDSYRLDYSFYNECCEFVGKISKTVFLENVLELEKIEISDKIFLLSCHFINENFKELSSISLHGHFIILCDNPNVENFFQNKLSKFKKSIILPLKYEKCFPISFSQDEIQEKKTESKEGAVPSSPPREIPHEKTTDSQKKIINKFDGISQEKSSNIPNFDFSPEKNPNHSIKFKKYIEERPSVKKTHKKEKTDWRNKIRDIFSKNLQILMKGHRFKKYNFSGIKFFQPKNRELIFSSNMERFALFKPGEKNKKTIKFFSLDEIVGVSDGRETKNFSRFKTKSIDKIEKSFSIVLKNRSIDLEAGSLKEKVEFCEALKTVLSICDKCKQK